MTELFQTTLERRSASRLARGLAVDAAKTLRADAQRAIGNTVRALNELRECGVRSDFLDDTLAGLLDEASRLQASIDHGLDGADPHAEGLDLVDVHALLGKVRA